MDLKNDDVFMPQDLFAAKDTPIHKKFNLEHNEKSGLVSRRTTRTCFSVKIDNFCSSLH